MARWFRFGLSVSGPFVCRCLTSQTMLRFHSPPHQTGRADFPHPAFRLASLASTRRLRHSSGVSPTTSLSSLASKVLSVTAQSFIGVDRPKPISGLLVSSRNSPKVRLLRSLRHYPASSLLRACPPPQTTRPAPHGVPVESHELSSKGFPVLLVDSSFTHAIATTPARLVDTCRS